MTVVAWDGKVLAADGQATGDDWRISVVGGNRKIHRLGGGRFLGASGCPVDIQKVIHWLNNNRMDPFPTVNDGNWLYVEGEHCSFIDQKGSIFKVNPPCAIGAGANIAMGAMLAGANAVKAVDIACILSIYCGHPIDHVDTLIKPKDIPVVPEPLSPTMARAQLAHDLGGHWEFVPTAKKEAALCPEQ